MSAIFLRMGGNQRIYRANRLFTGFFSVLFFGLAGMVVWPPAVAYVREGRLGSDLAFLNDFAPDQRMLFFYGFTALMLLAGIQFFRFFIDDRVVFIDDEGIIVKHPYSVHAGSWGDYEKSKITGFGQYKQLKLVFRDGTSPTGGRNKRKLALPLWIYGVNLNAVAADATLRILNHATATAAQARGRPAPGARAAR